jgi:hypothetical protein
VVAPGEEAVAEVAAAATGGSASSYVLKLNGGDAYAETMAGGAIAVEVNKVPSTGSLKYMKKAIVAGSLPLSSAVKYDPITFEVGLDKDSPLFSWMAVAWSTKPGEKHDFDIGVADFNGKEKHKIVVEDAVLSEVRFPALVQNATGAAYLSVKVQPKSIEHKPGSGASLGAPSQGAKAFFLGGFSLQLDGQAVDVKKIDPIVIQTPNTNNVDFPNVLVTVPAGDADMWTNWLQDMGKNGSNASNMKNGEIVLKDAAQKKIGSIVLNNVGIRRVTQSTADNVTAELFVERISLELE